MTKNRNKKKTTAINKHQKKKKNYDQIHSSILLAISYNGDEIINLSNLNAFTSIRINADISFQSSSSSSSSSSSNNPTPLCVPAPSPAPAPAPAPANATTTNHHTNLQLKCYRTPLPPNIYNQCMELFQTNMRTLYENSNWGLDLDLKNEELSHPNARFLIVTAENGDGDDKDNGNINDNGNSGGEKNNSNNDEKEAGTMVVAFTHFRFECSYDECNDNNHIYTKTIPYGQDSEHEPILYLYEIQIDSQIQRHGIGKKLMTFLQIIAMKMNMVKVVLTVFKSNTRAVDFYKRKLGYQLDVSSPDYFSCNGNNDDDDRGIDWDGGHNVEEDADYQILSKYIQIAT